jgi:hypothetical protein
MTASPVPQNGDEQPESPKDRIARNIKSSQNHSGIGQFKLASIDQMGGLSSLMVESSPTRVNGGIVLDTKEDFESPIKKRKSDEISELYEDEIAGKSRACKGKRYEQFMTPTKKATKQKSSTNTLSTASSPPTSSVQHFPHNGYCKPQQPDNGSSIKDDSCDEMVVHSPESDETEPRNVNDANDFKLNDKIMTLPSLDLDDYLNRKKAMKKKKKFTRKFED